MKRFWDSKNDLLNIYNDWFVNSNIKTINLQGFKTLEVFKLNRFLLNYWCFANAVMSKSHLFCLSSVEYVSTIEYYRFI